MEQCFVALHHYFDHGQRITFSLDQSMLSSQDWVKSYPNKTVCHPAYFDRDKYKSFVRCVACKVSQSWVNLIAERLSEAINLRLHNKQEFIHNMYYSSYT